MKTFKITTTYSVYHLSYYGYGEFLEAFPCLIYAKNLVKKDSKRRDEDLKMYYIIKKEKLIFV